MNIGLILMFSGYLAGEMVPGLGRNSVCSSPSTLHHQCGTPVPSTEQLLATEPHSYYPHVEGPWGLAQDSRCGISWGL